MIDGTNEGARDYLDLLPPDLGPWAVVANITRDLRGDERLPEKLYGTPVFGPGAKVYIGAVDGGRRGAYGVVGQNRVSKKLSVCMVSVRVLENFRPKVVYDTAVLKKLLYSEFLPQLQEDRRGEMNTCAGTACLFINKSHCEDFCEALISNKRHDEEQRARARQGEYDHWRTV